MSSTVNGLSSFDPLALINSLIAPVTSAASTATTNVVSPQQELSAMQKSGDLEGLLSDNIAVGVMQIANPASTPSAAGTGVTSLVNQLIAAYTSPAAPEASSTSSSATPQSAATLSTNPALATIQAMESAGSLNSTLADSIAASALGQTTG